MNGKIEQQITLLLEKFADGSITPGEQEAFNKLLSNLDDSAFKRIIKGYEKIIIGHGSHELPDPQLIAKVGKRLDDHVDIIQPEPIKLSRYFKFGAAAAVILVLITTATYFYTNSVKVTPTLTKTLTQDLSPGINKATLTLSNGQKIIITNAQNGTLAVQGSVAVNKTDDGKVVYNGADKPGVNNLVYNTLTTPRGGKVSLTLSDGTKVWLDAASSIKYPVAFAGRERKVEVTGQAYFEVVHNDAMPFKVSVKGETIEDIGTHFNVNAYDDEPNLKTTLIEGCVKVSNQHDEVILKPGQQSILAANSNNITVTAIDPEVAIAWKEGHFHFDSDDIRTVMRQLSRWYNVDVKYDGAISTRKFSGDIDRNSNASVVLQILSLSKVHFKIAGNKIIVTP